MVFLRLQRNQRHKQRLVNPLSLQHFIAVLQQLALHVHAKTSQKDLLIRKIFVAAGAKF
ncbi:Uncharacterised protein [Shigella sonnei]|nr:Uncharacterised protein [Shigella sonnei]